MTPLDHLVAALVQLEQQAQEIEHRQSFIRSAIESFGVDADDALLVAVRAEDEQELTPLTLSQSRAIDAGIKALRDIAAAESPPPPAPRGPQPGRENERLTPEDDHENKAPTAAWFDSNNELAGLSYRQPGTKQWDWESIGNEITLADYWGWRRVKHLQDAIGVSAATAQWMVKRCRELSLIDAERPRFDEQKARDAAAAAI